MRRWNGVPLPAAEWLNELINTGPNGWTVREWHTAVGVPEVQTFGAGVAWLEQQGYVKRYGDRAYATLQNGGRARRWLISLTLHPEDPLIATIMASDDRNGYPSEPPNEPPVDLD
jgi:hypothetical protein